MIRRLLIFLLLILSTYNNSALGTAQFAEKITFNGNKYLLLCTPLESLRSKADSLNINLPDFPSYFSESGIIRTSTGNWRGYIATWIIDNDTLYLTNIKDIFNKKSANLKEIFDNFVVDNKVMAFWYTGDLRIAKGDRINYIHMGFMSTYEKEIFIEVEGGIVKNVQEFKNEYNDPPKGFRRIMTFNLFADIPKSLIECHDPASDTLCYQDATGEIHLYGFVNRDFNMRLDRNGQQEFVVDKIDSCAQLYSDDIAFSDPVYEKQRFGYVGWTVGTAHDNSGMMQVLVMSNLYSRLFVNFIYQGQDRKKFEKIVDIFAHSLILIEFSY